MIALLAAAGALGQSPEPVRHIAYSLKVAQQRIEQAGGNWRRTEPAVLNLAGVNKVEGFVFDASTGDLILVGQREAARAALTLDDIVVAFRARFVHDRWPLVSIDPTADTDKTHMQHVRFEGGIEDTAFGRALFEADFRLKELGMGLQAPGVRGLRSAWERLVEEWEDKGGGPGQQNISSRFWFYPISPHVEVREGVCVVRGLIVGVFTEVLEAKIGGRPAQDVKSDKGRSNEAWAIDVSERFDQLSAAQPSFNRLRSLQELVAVSKALQELEERPSLSWWLEKYPLERIQTPKQVKVLRRRTTKARRRLELSGGVHLTAVAMRLRAGDAGALREAALHVRPSSHDLSWGFVAGEWLIPTGAGQVQSDELALLLAQAWFLVSQGRHLNALSAVDQALTLSPGLADGWKLKGALLASLYRDREALECFDRALELGPRDNDSWQSKAQLLTRLGSNEDALAAVSRALELNPSDAGAWLDKSLVLTRLGRVPETLECYQRILEINPLDAGAWRMRGLALATVGRYDEALISLAHALRINPRDGEAWYNQALYLAVLRRYDEAQKAMRKAAEVGHEVAREVLDAAK